MGLQGIPAATEENAIARDLALARFTKARLHIAHVSAAESVELIRHAKERGVAVTAEVTPHHLTLTENRVMGKKQSAIGSHPSRIGPLPTDAYDTDAKVNPPLRTEEDRQALVQGLKDGIIDAIATDHAPHTWVDKTCEFGLAAFGISGLETALGALMGLVKDGEIDLTTLISKLTLGPAQILGARYSGLGTIMEGSVADITVFDPEDEWLVTDEVMASKGKNTPFEGCMLRGRAMATVIEGDVVHGAEHIRHGGGK
jgi:dihydroorotase